MPIVIRLAYRRRTPDDPLRRPECGWYEGMSEEDAWTAARGTWRFDLKRRGHERYAFVVGGHTGDGPVLAAVELDPTAGERASDGKWDFGELGRNVKLLPPPHPLRRYTTDPTGVRSRYSVLYVDLPEAQGRPEPRTCACGCGAEVTRDFAIGHDRRAVQDRINRHFGGSTLAFMDWIDEHGPAAGYDERNGPPGDD